jgi:hypothetical protein
LLQNLARESGKQKKSMKNERKAKTKEGKNTNPSFSLGKKNADFREKSPILRA